MHCSFEKCSMHQAAPQPASRAGMFWSGSKGQKRASSHSPLVSALRFCIKTGPHTQKKNQKEVITVNIKGTGIQNEEKLNSKPFYTNRLYFKIFRIKVSLIRLQYNIKSNFSPDGPVYRPFCSSVMSLLFSLYDVAKHSLELLQLIPFWLLLVTTIRNCSLLYILFKQKAWFHWLEPSFKCMHRT